MEASENEGLPRDPSADTRLVGVLERLDHEETEVLSLDIFDTLVWRVVPEPVDAFVLLGHRLREQGRLRPQVSAHLFARLRERAEVAARRQVETEGRIPEVSLHAVYAAMPAHLFGGASAEDLADIEVGFERQITFADLEVFRLAELAQQKLGTRLVLVSDTYYSESQLRRILDREPFRELRIEQIFTSSQYGVGKGSGLFPVVLRHLGVKPERVLHIGDNIEADVRQARSEGIPCVHFDKYARSIQTILEREGIHRKAGGHHHRPKTVLDLAGGDFGLTAVRSKVLHRSDAQSRAASANPYWRFGASVLGPVFTAFAEWVHHRARAEGFARVYCLMREGEFLSRLVNGARGYLASDVEAKTLWLSRQVCSRASIFEGTPEELGSFFHRRVPPTLPQLCESLGIDLGRLSGVHTDADSRIEDPEVAERVLEAIAGQPLVRAAVVSGAATLRARLIDYLLSTIEPDGGRAMVVDLGWGCTIQSSLDGVLRNAGADLATVGLYLLTNEGVIDRMLSGTDAEGFLASGGVPDGVDWITRSPEIVEQVCMHDEGSLVGFDDDGQPVHGGSLLSPSQVLQRTAVQAGILAFQREWARYSQFVPPAARALHHESARPLLAKMLTRFVVAPTLEETGMFASWLHDDNFGSKAADTMVPSDMAASLGYMTPNQLVQLPMSQVYWPFGLAALYNRPLALAAAAVAEDVLPAETFEPSKPTRIALLVDVGGGYSDAVDKPAGPNTNSLGYFSADVHAKPIRGLMLRCSDGPGVLRVDWLGLTFHLEGKAEPVVVRIESPADFAQLKFRNGVPMADNLVLSSRSAPEVVYRCPQEWTSPYRVEIEMAFAWMPVSPFRGPPRANAEVLLHVSRRVHGKLRNLWDTAGQEASEHFWHRP